MTPLEAIGGRAYHATPEALFAAFVEALRDLHARGGMHDVLRLAAAASTRFGATAPPPDRAAAAPAFETPSGDDLLEAVIGALERAFRRGGLEAVVDELSQMGAVVRRVVRDAAPAPAA